MTLRKINPTKLIYILCLNGYEQRIFRLIG